MNTYRSVFLSDLHLGTRWCKARDLVAFLSSFSCERLYLVGDIIDGWKLQKKSSWPRSHNRVLQELFRISQESSVTYVTGNHDSFLDEYHGNVFGNIAIRENATHITADGRKMLVLHGDEFDAVMTYGKWLARLGDTAYDLSLWMNSLLNNLRSVFGMPYWSLSQHLKHKVKDAVNFISDFEERLAEEVHRRNLDGVICGHIHRPALRTMGDVLYANCGDWVESCSAMLEHHDGTLEMFFWHQDNWKTVPRVTAQGELVLPQNLPQEHREILEGTWSVLR